MDNCVTLTAVGIDALYVMAYLYEVAAIGVRLNAYGREV